MRGGGIKHLTKGMLDEYEFSLPDIEEQSRVVFILNAIQKIIIKRRKSIELSDEYLKSTFSDKFLSKKWGKEFIGKFISEANYGTALKPNDEEKGVPVLRMNNISYDGLINLDNIKWVDFEDNKNELLTLNNRDLIFNRTNSQELVGKTAIWDKSESTFTFAGYLIRIKLKETLLNPYYLWGFLNSSLGKKVLYTKGQPSGNMVNISLSLLKKIQIPIPPIKLQEEFEYYYHTILNLKFKKENSYELLLELFQSLQYNLFNKKEKQDEIEVFIDDEFKVDELLKSIINFTDKSEQQYNTEKDLLFKILERTKKNNKDNKDYLKGIVLKFEQDKIVLKTNKEDKFNSNEIN